MFFVSDLSHTLFLPPHSYTKYIKKTLYDTLYSHVEGTCTGEHGFIVAVLEIKNIEGGKLSHNGFAIFTIIYKALLLKPVKSEVVDAVIVDINNLGMFCSVGPLSIFVSNYHIPLSLQQTNKLQKDGAVRIRIIGTKIDTKKIYAIGSMDEECLGVINM
ncbi:DNA-directed RNA polymerase II subunit [Binucleata daphniae]